jgi:hypothetical protein
MSNSREFVVAPPELSPHCGLAGLALLVEVAGIPLVPIELLFEGEQPLPEASFVAQLGDPITLRWAAIHPEGWFDPHPVSLCFEAGPVPPKWRGKGPKVVAVRPFDGLPLVDLRDDYTFELRRAEANFKFRGAIAAEQDRKFLETVAGLIQEQVVSGEIHAEVDRKFLDLVENEANDFPLGHGDAYYEPTTEEQATDDNPEPESAQ